MEKALISLRFPMDLLSKVDEEAQSRERSRAFILIEKVKNSYNGNDKKKPATKTRKKVKAVNA